MGFELFILAIGLDLAVAQATHAGIMEVDVLEMAIILTVQFILLLIMLYCMPRTLLAEMRKKTTLLQKHCLPLSAQEGLEACQRDPLLCLDGTTVGVVEIWKSYSFFLRIVVMAIGALCFILTT